MTHRSRKVADGMPEHAARFKGYSRGLIEAGISEVPSLVVPADNSEEIGYKAAQHLLGGNEQFDAVFAATDLLAIGAMRAMQDAGKRIPEDVSVVGFDDMPLASHVTPALTTVQQNTRQAGEQLVAGIVGVIEGEPVESTLMAPKLIVRNSCGAGT